MALRSLLLGIVGTLMAMLIACGGDGAPPPPAPRATPTSAGPAAVATPTRSPTVTPVRSPTVTPAATANASPVTGTTGNPFSLGDLQRVWEARGMRVTVGARAAGFSGLGTTAFDLRATRGDASLNASVLVYANREAPLNDWELAPGKVPTPKASRSLPAHVSVWWNENLVLVVRSRSGEVANEALAAFLALAR